jgi:AcrR family transcriptional regulator
MIRPGGNIYARAVCSASPGLDIGLGAPSKEGEPPNGRLIGYMIYMDRDESRRFTATPYGDATTGSGKPRPALLGTLRRANGLTAESVRRTPPIMAGRPVRSYKSTPMAIIEAAERLFGSYGIETVSLRQIGLEANVANKSAVSYHFGDRAELVRAIWQHRLPALEARRKMLLRQIHERGESRDPHAIVRLLVQPNYELLDTQGVHRYTAFFRHALRWRQGQELRAREMGTTPASMEAIDLLAALAPHIPQDLLLYRLRYGCCSLFDMIFDRDCDLAEGHAVMPEDEFLAEGIDMVVSMCLRPIPPIRPR